MNQRRKRNGSRLCLHAHPHTGDKRQITQSSKAECTADGAQSTDEWQLLLGSRTQQVVLLRGSRDKLDQGQLGFLVAQKADNIIIAKED